MFLCTFNNIRAVADTVVKRSRDTISSPSLPSPLVENGPLILLLQAKQSFAVTSASLHVLYMECSRDKI